MRKTETATRAADEITDLEIDTLLPAVARRAARMYWTTVAVAHRVAQIFERLEVRRVLDLGSGPGKFCIAAAAHAPRIDFVGIEHRPHLVAVARSIGVELRIPNVTFIEGDATRASWTDFDGLYAFNSFAENDFSPDNQLDQTVELSHARHIADIRRVTRQLELAAVGTVLVTYHGLTGPIPRSFDLLHVETIGSGLLRAWRKEVPSTGDMYWLEEGNEISAWAQQPAADAEGDD